MLKLDKMVGFLLTTKPNEAREFFSGKLGFMFIHDDGFALVFDASGVMLRVSKMQSFTPAPHTVLGWEVADINAAVQELEGRGVQFERYEFMHPDAQGICTFPTGDKVAWFKDPDGNVLSLSQHANK
jgi:catechol 2,3-dioxygenase-like lactoylglutathione lyase family enzyme